MATWLAMDVRPTSRQQGMAVPLIVAIVLTLAALLLRGLEFGNPAVDLDEQFYLLAGDRMVHGLLPYVDIWDRKPIGNFLIFAAIRLLGGDGIWQYQIVATGCAIATAFLLQRIARRLTEEVGATAVAVGYLVYLNVFGGIGGQSPVFYNLAIVGAASLAVAAIGNPARPVPRQTAMAAMALLGLAFQIKTTVVFEGVLLFAWLVHGNRRGRMPASRQLVEAGLLLAAAGLPSLLVVLFYVGVGQLHALLFATGSSILLRAPLAGHVQAKFLLQVVISLIPLAPPAVAGTKRAVCSPIERELRHFIAGWLVAGSLAFVAIGNFYSHYALQLIAPLLLLGAPAVRTRSLWSCYLLALFFVRIVSFSGDVLLSTREHRAQVHGLVAAARPYAGQCLHIFEGPPSVYLLTGACTVSPYLFPEHLVIAREAGAIGTDQATEVGRIFARRPGMIITAPRTFQPPNPAIARLIRAHLRRDYRETYVAPPIGWSGAILQPHLFVRRDLVEARRGTAESASPPSAPLLGAAS